MFCEIEIEDNVFERLPPYEMIGEIVRFPMYVIYNSPSDYPGKYVVRVWDLNIPTNLVAVADSYEQIMKSIPTKRVCNWGRTSIDDPCIVETWF